MSEITIITNPCALAAEELIDEYEKISQCYCKLKDNTEKCEQQIFQLKRNLELSEKRESYLSQELELLTECHEKEMADAKQKYNAETQNLRTRLTNVEQINGELECEIERLKGDTVEIDFGSKANEACMCGNKANESVPSNSQLEYLEKLENDRMCMLQDMDDLKGKLVESMQCLARNETELENIKDCFDCSQENLRSKNQELYEKNQIIDSLQERIVELNAELADYKSGNNGPNKKGNSLFAEVDDQRQHMKQILAQQKQQYLKMKREHQEGQLKIRRLQRENVDMHREVQQCSEMLQNSNHYYKKSLNNTIGFLEDEVSKLREKLRLTECRLISLAKENKVTWLESMLDYCKKETESLKDQLYVTRLQKCEAEGLYIESKQQAARWRFEALKSRCIIVDREVLLEQHNIPFGPLAKVGNIVESLYKDGTREIPNISHQIPITPQSTLEPTNSVIINDYSFSSQSVSDSVGKKKHISDDIQSTLSSTIDYKISNANATDLLPIRSEYLAANNSIKCEKSVQGDSTDVYNQELNEENQTFIRNARPLAALSTTIPRFQPINISSERMEELSRSIVEVDAETSSTANTIQTHTMKSRPKVVVKHIVLKRE